MGILPFPRPPVDTVELDPLRGSAYIPLPRRIQTRRAVVNVPGTGNDYYKWVILAGMHPVDVYADRLGKYIEHMGKYDFSSLSFTPPLVRLRCETTCLSTYMVWTMTRR